MDTPFRETIALALASRGQSASPSLSPNLTIAPRTI